MNSVKIEDTFREKVTNGGVLKKFFEKFCYFLSNEALYIKKGNFYCMVFGNHNMVIMEHSISRVFNRSNLFGWFFLTFFVWYSIIIKMYYNVIVCFVEYYLLWRNR